jgi:hypothetical protein
MRPLICTDSPSGPDVGVKSAINGGTSGLLTGLTDELALPPPPPQPVVKRDRKNRVTKAFLDMMFPPQAIGLYEIVVSVRESVRNQLVRECLINPHVSWQVFTQSSIAAKKM